MLQRGVILLILLCLFEVKVKAQDWLGYHTSTYAGINAVHINPALITGTNYKKFDLSLVAGHANISNSYVLVSSETLVNYDLFSDPNFQQNYMSEVINGLHKSAFANVNIQGPAVLVNITSRDAIGFSPRVRGFVNADHVDERLARLLYRGLDFPALWNQTLEHDYMSVNANLWAEYGLSYARTIYEDDKQSFKGGISLRLLQGLASGYLTARDGSYLFYNDDSMALNRMNMSYGVTQNLESNSFSFDFVGGPGFGMDLGFTYERFPEANNNGIIRKKQNNNRLPGIFAPDETRYKWKVGLSINDIGSIPYTKSANSRDFYADVNPFVFNTFDGINGVNSLNNRIQANFQQANDNAEYWMDLPTHMNVFFDYRFQKGFALNTTGQIAFQHGQMDDTKNHYLYQISVTPRWESKWFGVYMPVSFNEHLLFNLGVSLRLGPLVIGTGDLLGNLIKGYYGSTDVHFALRLIIPDGKKKSGNKRNNFQRKQNNGLRNFKGSKSKCPAF